VKGSLLQGTLKYAAARGLPGVVNFAALAVLTRLMSEREYGVYALTVAAVSLVYSFSLQWLGLAVLRLLHVPGRSRQVFLGAIIRLFLAIVLPVAVAGAIIGAFGFPQLPTGLSIAAAFLFIGQAWLDLNLGLASADGDPARYGRIAALRATGGLTGGALAAWLGIGPAGVVGGIAVGWLATGFITFSADWRAALRVPSDRPTRNEVLHYGIPLAGTYVLDYLVSSSDRLLLGALVSSSATGLYAPAYDLCQQPIWALMMIINLAAYPLSVRAIEQGDPNERDRHFRQHFMMLAAIGLPSATGLAVLAPSVSALLGPAFADTARRLIPILAGSSSL